MRLAYICADPGIPVFGSKGCSIHVQEVIRAMRKQGVEVELFHLRQGGSPPEDLRDLVHHRFSLRHAGGGANGVAAREAACRALNLDFMRQLKKRPAFDAVYERYSLWSVAGMDFARRSNIPGVLEVNAPLIREQLRHRRLDDLAAAKSASARNMRQADVVVAVSEEVARELQEGFAISGEIRVIPNGVDLDRFDPAQVIPIGKKSGFTVGFCGSLKSWHGVSVLIEAFRALAEPIPEARLLIVGDGPEGESIRRDLREAGLEDRSLLTGAVPSSSIPGYLASMDVATAPYLSGEFYFSPLKVFEYMAMALPVVVGEVGQLSQLVKHEFSGLLCPPGDARALAKALVRLHEAPLLGKRLGHQARLTVQRNHSWDTVASRILGEISSRRLQGSAR